MPASDDIRAERTADRLSRRIPGLARNQHNDSPQIKSNRAAISTYDDELSRSGPFPVRPPSTLTIERLVKH
jgi:hypothetical protein